MLNMPTVNSNPWVMAKAIYTDEDVFVGSSYCQWKIELVLYNVDMETHL